MPNPMKALKTASPFTKYLMYSVAVTIVDSAAVWLLMNHFAVELVYANTVGMILGFFIHYILSSQSVFQTEYGASSFIVYVGTFILGIFLAGGLISISYHKLFYFLPETFKFLFSKGVSVVVPFFILYYIRKSIYKLMGTSCSSKGDVTL
jgi:putative flippase GtrA